MAAMKRDPSERCSLAAILTRDAVGVDRKVCDLDDVTCLDNAKRNLNTLQVQNDAAHAKKTLSTDRLKMTDKEITDLRSAMSAFQRDLEEERRKAKLFRGEIERLKNDVQENGFEVPVERLMSEAQRTDAVVCDECRKYEYKCANHDLRNHWRGCGCSCTRTLTCDSEGSLVHWTPEGMSKGLVLDSRGADGNGAFIKDPNV